MSVENVCTSSAQPRTYKFLFFIAMLNAIILATSTVLGYKQINIAGITAYGATLIFPLTYVLQDIMAEVYGYKITRHLIWGGMLCALISAALLVSVVHLPASPNWQDQHAYDVVLDPVLRVILASIIGITASSFINVYALTKWKILVQGRYFWLRSLTSTALGEFMLTTISVLIGFIGRADFHTIFSIIITAFLFKLAASTILLYPEVIIVNYLKRTEKVDVFDYSTNFNPFKFNIN